MKNFKFINQSLWAGSSPNQTDETLTRENRIGVKSWLNRGLMLLITILTLGVGQMWADNGDFYNMYIAYSFEGVGGAIDGDDNNTGVTVDAGTLTSGSLTLTGVYLKCWDDWGANYKSSGGQLCYTNKGGSTQYISCTRSGKSGNNYEYQNSNPGVTLASYNQASGSFEFHCWGQTWGWGDRYFPKSSGHYVLKYKIAPPAVSSFSVSEANHLAGDGSKANPYILPYNGTLSLTISGSQAHSDANSSAQYYNTSSSNAWSTTATKSISGITSTTATSVTVKMRYNNSTASVSGAESEKEIWYKSEAVYSVTVSNDGHGTTTPSGAQSNIGTLSGLSISASNSTGYQFDTWEITSGDGSFTSAATTASNTFKPTEASTITATFAANTYSITLDKNGGTSGGSATATYDASSISVSTTPSNDGYAVEGYYLDAECTVQIADDEGTLNASVEYDDKTYTDGSGKWIYDDNCTVYTKWMAAATMYSLRFAVCSEPWHNGTVSATVGGSAATSGYKYNDQSNVVITASPSSHYRVNGWYREALHTNVIAGTGTDATYSFKLTKDTSVFVAFELSTATITLDKNGGDAGASSVAATHGSTLPSFTAHTKAGYSLTGYYTETSGGTKIINANGSLVANTDYANSSSQWNNDISALTLHAQWSEDKETLTPTVSYDHGTSSYTASADNTIGVETASRIKCSEPNAAHYTFVGWTLTNLTVTSGDKDKDTIIYVKKTSAAGATPAAVANYNEVLDTDWALKGTFVDDFGTAYDFKKKSGESTGKVAYTSLTLAANTNYQFKVITGETWYGNNNNTDGEKYWIKSSVEDWTFSSSDGNCYMKTGSAGLYTFKIDYSGANPKISVEYPSQFIKGDWTKWAEVAFDDYGCYRVELAAGTYEFCIMDKGDAYKKDKTISATTYDELFSTSGNNCKISVASKATYVFGWNSETKKLSVVFPADLTKCKFIKDEYIYFDTRRLSSAEGGWNHDAFSTRYWLKNFASGLDYGKVECSITDTVETGIFYFKVPAENLGQMQINRMSTNLSTYWNTTSKIYMIDRGTATTKNLLIEETGHEAWSNNWTPQWAANSYCPPMKTAKLADNGTSKHRGAGTKADPYLIEAGTEIKVTAASSTAFNDDAHMTHKYHFYDGATSKSDQTGATYSFTASSTVNDIHKVVVMPYNTYSGQSSTKRIKSDTLFYKVVQHYTITYNGNGNDGGSVPTDATHYITGEEATVLGNSGSLAIEGYSFNGWKDGSEVSHSVGSTITIGTSNVTLYAQWTDDHTYYFHGGALGTGTDWNTAANWTKNKVPNDIANTIYILKPVEIPAGTTIKAAAVDIVTSGTYTRPFERGTIDGNGKLTIAATAELIINGALHTSAAPSFSPKDTTTAQNLILESSASGNAGLTWGTANSSPGAAKVYFYSKSGGSKNSNISVNQYVGTPFTSATNQWVYNYDNSWLLGADYSGSAPAWKLLGRSDSMDPFKGYCLIYNGSTGNTYEMSGTLVTNADQTISLQYKDATKSHNENVLANSWTAPIKISTLTTLDFTNAEATIYIFNSGSKSDKPGAAAINATSPAQWIAIPVNAASWGADPTVEVIPSMQSFSVYSTAANAKLTLDYSSIVYDQAANGTAGIVANRAPKRETEEKTPEEVAPVVMHLFVNGESGYGDAVWMLEREDFTTGFDNGWDGHKIYGDAVAPQMFVVSSDGEMAVAAVPDFGGTVLGFKAGSEDNVYTFTFDYSEDETPLYMIDMNTQTYTRVVEGNEYIFSTTDTDTHNRFVLTHNAPSIATDIDNLGDEIICDKAVKLIKDGRLYIIRDGQIYSTDGQMVK